MDWRVVDACVHRCSTATQQAYAAAKAAAEIKVRVADERRGRITVATIFVHTVEGMKCRADVRRNSEHDYRVLNQNRPIPGFDEPSLIEFGRACICAVRKNGRRG